jgi:uncharacterized protein YndB with AHSA1/START domain
VGTERLHPHDHELRSAAGRRLALRHAGPDGRDYQNRITFEEIVPPKRIVYRHGGGDDVEPVHFKQTVIFEDIGGRTRITCRSDFPSAAERDRLIKEYRADTGLEQHLARLDNYVSSSANHRRDNEQRHAATKGQHP